MVKQEIELLESQILKLSAADFDFEAWKKYSLLMLTRLFGKDDPKINQLINIDFEFNSWSLRDASGNESYEEGSKRLAREVLQAAIDELKIYGLPKKEENPDEQPNEILTIILDEFTGSQVKELKKILKSRNNLTEKRRLIQELILELGTTTNINIIANILSNQKLVSLITK